jgi:hypothetical protein
VNSEIPAWIEFIVEMLAWLCVWADAEGSQYFAYKSVLDAVVRDDRATIQILVDNFRRLGERRPYQTVAVIGAHLIHILKNEYDFRPSAP